MTQKWLGLRAGLVSLALFALIVGVWHLATAGSGTAVKMDPEYAKLMGATATQGKSAMPGPAEVGAKITTVTYDPNGAALRVALLDATTNNRIPAIVAVLASDRDEAPAFVFAAAANLDTAIAAADALMNLAETRRLAKEAQRTRPPPSLAILAALPASLTPTRGRRWTGRPLIVGQTAFPHMAWRQITTHCGRITALAHCPAISWRYLPQ